MEIVDVNVSKLDKYNMEYEYDFESLWYSMFDDGTMQRTSPGRLR